MAYLLDSDWAIREMNGYLPAHQALLRLRSAPILVSIITVAELYDGAFKFSNPEARLVDIRHFLSSFQRLPIDDRVAEKFAETRAWLRRRGTPISDFDIIIGGTALVHDLTVLTFNTRHFERIPDLKLYQVGT